MRIREFVSASSAPIRIVDGRLRVHPCFEIARMSSRSRRCPPADADPPTPPAGSLVCLLRAFYNHQDLVNRADVDAITITVKVPNPFELATAALDVDKADYCEWPLGNKLKEAETLAALAKKSCPRHGRASGPLRAVGGLSTRPDQARVRR